MNFGNFLGRILETPPTLIKGIVQPKGFHPVPIQWKSAAAMYSDVEKNNWRRSMTCLHVVLVCRYLPQAKNVAVFLAKLSPAALQPGAEFMLALVSVLRSASMLPNVLAR